MITFVLLHVHNYILLMHLHSVDASQSLAAASDSDSLWQVVFHFPGDRTGLIIGKDGQNIREVENETNTHIDIDKRDRDPSKNGRATITGKEENCKKALRMILENLHRKINRHLAVTETVMIPNRALCGKVIGKNGSTRHAIESLSGARLKIDDPVKEGLEGLLNFDQPRVCKITGSPEQIENARELMQSAMDGQDIVQEATVAAVIATLMKEFRKMGFEFEIPNKP